MELERDCVYRTEDTGLLAGGACLNRRTPSNISTWRCRRAFLVTKHYVPRRVEYLKEKVKAYETQSVERPESNKEERRTKRRETDRVAETNPAKHTRDTQAGHSPKAPRAIRSSMFAWTRQDVNFSSFFLRLKHHNQILHYLLFLRRSRFPSSFGSEINFLSSWIFH